MAGMTSVQGAGTVAAAPEDVFAFLADLRNHWQLAAGWVRVVSLDEEGDGSAAAGGRVLVRGPLGLRREAWTRVLAAEPGRWLEGEARVGARTVAHVRWELRAAAPGTHVTLRATVLRAAALDRALLALGGRRWLGNRFAATVRRLDRRLAASAGELSRSATLA